MHSAPDELHFPKTMMKTTYTLAALMLTAFVGTAAHAELVDAENERELLALFRSVPRRSQDLILDLFGALIASKEGKRGKRTPVSRITF